MPGDQYLSGDDEASFDVIAAQTSVTLSDNPFGVGGATGKTTEANDLQADRRMVIDYARDMPETLSDAALKLKIQEIDQLFVDHDGEFVITFISSQSRDTDVNKYTLPTGSDLTAYHLLITNIVERYSAHSGCGGLLTQAPHGIIGQKKNGPVSSMDQRSLPVIADIAG